MKGYAIFDNIKEIEVFSGKKIEKEIFMNSQEPLIVYPNLKDAQDLAEFCTMGQRGVYTVFLVDYVYFQKEIKKHWRREYASKVVFLCPLETYDSTDSIYVQHNNGYYLPEVKNPFKINDEFLNTFIGG